MKLVRVVVFSALILCMLTAGFAAPKTDSDEIKALLDSAPPSSAYPNSGFINLIDEAKGTINPDGSWSTVTRVTAKIFNERGRSIANVHLAYNSAFENLRIIRARTIRKDGTVVEVKPQDIQEISPYSGYALYSSVKAKVMIMPAVEDDCIIDYEWEVSGKQNIMPSSFWTGWFYQSQEPTVLSRYTLEVPADRKFTHVPYNTNIAPRVTRSKDGKTVTYVWEGRDYGEIDPEPYMPPMADICPWFELSSIASWDEVAEWYRKLVTPQMKATPEIKQTVQDLIKDKSSPAEKAKTIFYWVEDKIRYVGLEFGASAYEPHSAKDVFENRYGDCKDQATLLITMLREAGIEAYPVLVPVGYRGSTSKRLPSPGMFDHAIAVAKIDGEYVWLDTTAEVCPYGEIPEGDRGREVLVVKDDGSEFVRIPDFTAEKNCAIQTATIELNPEGGIAAKVEWYSVGSGDLAARATYKYAKPTKIKESLQATVASVAPDAVLTNFDISDPKDKDRPVKVSYEFTANGWANRIGKFLILRPGLYQNVLSNTPFSKPERKYDICFPGTSSNVSTTKLILPEGFTVEEIPESVSMKSDFGLYEKTYDLQGRTLNITERLVRHEARIPASRYQEVKKFFEDVIQAQKAQMVLRKED